MSQKTKKIQTSTPSASKSSRSSLLRSRFFWAGLILIAILAFAVWKFRRGGAAGYLPEDFHYAEPTLKAQNPVLQLLTPAETGVDFKNIILETPENNFLNNINIYNGGGVTVADINNDNLPDIYFVCSNGDNKMYLNEGNFKFRDITESSGLASPEGFETAVSAVDINSDGFLDFYVCRGETKDKEQRRNRLFINNGNLTFTERSKEYGLDDKSASSGAAFFDGDGDGDLDCYVLNYLTNVNHATKIDVLQDANGKPYPNLNPKEEYDTDRYYRNDGPPAALAGGKGGFTDISKASGIWNFAFGLSVSVTDFNLDGHPDIYVGNDFIQPDNLYINDGKGSFTNKLAEYVRHTSQNTMGTDLSDFDNDGFMDILAMDMMPAYNKRSKLLATTNPVSRYLSLVQNNYFEPVTRNVLQRNNGDGTFSEIGCLAGVFKTDWSWSGLIADWDNNGLKDIYVTTGYRRDIAHRDYFEFLLPEVRKKSNSVSSDPYERIKYILESIPDYKVRNFIFENGGDWSFADKSGDWATMEASWSCGAAWADLDLDGDLDLVINNLEDPAFIYKNLSREQNRGNYLQAKLKGSPQNPFAVGASVLIEYDNGSRQYQELSPNRGIFSSSEHLIHFGLGKTAQIARLTVRWPDGKFQTMQDVPVNQRLQLDYTNASGYVAHLIKPYDGPVLMRQTTSSSGVNFTHRENKYNDLEHFPLVPWNSSDYGPLMAKGDVNGDGLEDLFIGNGFTQPAGLYVQTPDGKFNPGDRQIWENDKQYEDHGAVFFDFDMDGDQDLFVVSGGMEAVKESAGVAWQNRLYINMDGKGTFGRANPANLPDIRDVGMRVTAYDYDGDGDQDLFIGGRVTPQKWPLTPPSRVIRNDRNRLTDVTDQVGGDFTRCGMVTDLQWADVDKDGQVELVVVGEWMPVSIFRMNGGKLQNVTESFGLGKSHGLWNCLELADLDQDGDLDLVTGNFGLNTRFKASEEAPLGCYAKDFDNNGTLDPIMTMFEGKNNYPLAQKEDITKQLPGLKKKFLYAKDWSEATIEDVWDKKELESALQLKAYHLETCWWENQGGKFVKRYLPNQTQASVIQGIIVEDLNQDGIVDLLLAGNKYDLEVEGGRCDAGNGVFLAGTGKGQFTWVDNTRSGFWANKEARDVILIRTKAGKPVIVVSNNNSGAQVFQ